MGKTVPSERLIRKSQALQRKCDGISGSIQDRQDQGTLCP